MNKETNDEKKWCVYVHINKINGKMYVGITCKSPNVRWRNGEGYHTQQVIYKAIQKYGWDNFEHIIICQNKSKREAKNIEKYLIKNWNTKSPFGYNVTEGGDGSYGYHHTEKTRKQMSEMRKGENHPLYGKHHSEETKNKISNSKSGEKHHLYGKHRSEEARKSISNALKGSHLSEERKKKISDAHKGKHIPQEVREKIRESVISAKSDKVNKVLQYDKEGNLIRIWNSIKQIQEELQISYSAINSCCRGKQKSSCGFIWKYAEGVLYGATNLERQEF